MRSRPTLGFAAAALTLAFLPGVQAQQVPPPAPGKAQGAQGVNPFGPGSPLGGQLAPLMMGFGSAFGGTVDFTHSNALNLLQRNDVRSELLLTAQQREKLDGLKAAAQQELMSKIISSAQENFQGIQDVPQEQRLEKVQDGLTKLQDTLKTYQNDQDKHIDELLTLKATGGVGQVDRLHQLDLQWRGPLGLSEKKLADALKLTPDQRSKTSTALADYLQVQVQAMQKAFTGAGANGQGGPPQGAGPGGFNPQEMQKKMSEAMQSDEMKKARKEAEKQVLQSLTPEQKETWNSWLGKPFIFRTNDN